VPRLPGGLTPEIEGFPAVAQRVRSLAMRYALRSSFVVAMAVLATLLALPGTASAASTTVGYDVSFPQCDTALPGDRAFGIVGVNGGISTRANPCLAQQLTWAWNSSGSVLTQPKAQVYLNSSNPGELLTQVTTWPKTGVTPYGACTGTNSTACSWQYGFERAQNSVISFFTPAAQAARVDSQPGRYRWWLDVETMNTWQSGSPAALARNRATIEGMAAYLTSRGGRVGIYSTNQQWGQIVGSVPVSSSLAGSDSWLAGASSLTGAQAACGRPALLPGGRVALTQYVQSGLDRNYACS
jgi:hypothetical protein